MDEVRAVVLLEGISDQIAVETLGARPGRNLSNEGISVVPMGGAQAMDATSPDSACREQIWGWLVCTRSEREA
jgi:hypothetical protein